MVITRTKDKFTVEIRVNDFTKCDEVTLSYLASTSIRLEINSFGKSLTGIDLNGSLLAGGSGFRKFT